MDSSAKKGGTPASQVKITPLPRNRDVHRGQHPNIVAIKRAILRQRLNRKEGAGQPLFRLGCEFFAGLPVFLAAVVGAVLAPSLYLCQASGDGLVSLRAVRDASRSTIRAGALMERDSV
ncbi:hypothetical protein Nepgr_007936 [Nepenthes gracilis]|uniref:Uncharacterized protein n=1 Tax=Nepenthes gracilis TaxID=150966 RepID=A0AAD3S8Q3_NEPGR|nr:hypothetical protein Nepgr_007936 [Nepenthes gracilis]